MLREVKVLLGHEHAFAEKVLVDLLTVSFWDKPCEKNVSKATFWDLHVLTLLRVPCALRGIAHNAGVVLGLTKVVVSCDGRSSEQYLNVRLKSWRIKRSWSRLPRTALPPTPLLPTPTLSACKSKVSGGESKVSRRVTGFLFRSHSPRRCLRDGYRIWVCRLRFFGSSCPISPTTLSLVRYFLRTTTAMAKQKITGDELSARAKANSYQKGVYRDKDSLRDRRECYVSMAEVHTSDCQKDFMSHQTFLSIRARQRRDKAYAK
jgi:hypothetical protein